MSETEENLRTALYKGNQLQAGRWLSEYVQERYATLRLSIKQQAALLAICQTVVISNQFLTPNELLREVACCLAYIM